MRRFWKGIGQVRTDPLVSVHAEQSGVVSLLHHHEGDSRLVVLLQFYTGLPDGQQLMLEHLQRSKIKDIQPISNHSRISEISSWFRPDLVELALRNAVAVVDDSGGLEASGFVELDEELPHHGGQVLDDVLAMLLHTHRGAVPAGVGVHATNNLTRGQETDI